MTAQELFTFLTNDAGLDEATATAVMAAAKNEKVAARASALVQKNEYDSLATRAAALEQEYNGSADGKKVGAKAYQDWYSKNYAEIVKLKEDVIKYQERFGPIDAAPAKPAAAAAAAQFSPEEVQNLVHKTIQEVYAPRWSDLLTGTGAIVQKHMRAGRKSDIDFKKLGELADSKGGDLMLAYDEYDKPEREAQQALDQEATIKRRVEEELQKRNQNQFFPAGADASASSGSTGITRPQAKDKTYDRSAVISAAVTGNYDGKPGAVN